jgi:hypothetical protein
MLEKYRKLRDKLEKLKKKEGELLDELHKLEGRVELLLDEMDDVWYALTDEDIKALDEEVVEE